jgi:hypothetical protein
MQRSESAASPYLSPIVSLVLVVVGILFIGAVAFLQPAQFFPSYLIAFVYWAEISLGCLGVLLVALLIRSRWGAAVQRPALAGAWALAALAVLFIPLLFGLNQLYPWTDSEYPVLAHLPPDGIHYLSVGFWILRSIVAFVIWIGLAFLLSRALNQNDSADDEDDGKAYQRAKNIAGIGAVFFVLMGAFVASVDWIMSLDPYWFSSIYGWLAVARQAMVGLAFIIIVLTIVSHHAAVGRLVNQRVVYDLSMLQLGTVMVWAYMHFFQYLIMWHGNLPKEAAWFVPRTTGGWQYFAIFLIVVNLIVPLVMLLAPVPKKTLGYVSIVSFLILVSHWVEVTWLVKPTFSPVSSVGWLDIALIVAVGAIWLVAFLWFLGREGLVPLRHPVYEEMVADEIERHAPGDLESPTPVSG